MPKRSKQNLSEGRMLWGKDFVSYLPGAFMLESGELAFGPLPAYEVPRVLMGTESRLGSSSASSREKPTPDPVLGVVHPKTSGSAQEALAALEALADIQRSAVEILKNAPPTSVGINSASSDEVASLLAAKQLLQMARVAIDYFAEKAEKSADVLVCEMLVEVGERAAKAFESLSNESLKKAVAQERAFLPVLVGTDPKHGEELVNEVRALGLGDNVRPRVKVNRAGRPFDKDTPINVLADSLIAYLLAIRARRPVSADTRPAEIAALPQELTNEIWSLPELVENPREWCRVGEKLILNSGLRLTDVPGLRTLGEHRRLHATAGRGGDRAVGLKGNMADGIRRALRQAFGTFAKKPID